MGKKRADQIDPLDRVFELLDEAPPGLHDVDPPADELPSGLPGPLIELYARCDGARIFVDTLEIVSASEVAATESGRWQFATLDGEPVSIDGKGKIWRTEESIEDEVCDGTRLDRWLAGQLDALDLVFDRDGEFNDDVFDEDGELMPIIREKQLRARLKRDPAAPAPRWRLAQLLVEQASASAGSAGARSNADALRSSIDEARNELEQVVADDPAFAWAWLDLARVSEQLGEATGAIDEARMAAEAAEGMQHPQAGYFWSQVARLASRVGNEMVRAEAATKASLLAPSLKRAQIDGVRNLLEAGDRDSAKGLVELLRAVWPRDLEVLELVRQVG